MRKNLKQNILALITAVIWGFAFVAQSQGAQVIGAFTFNAIRCVLAFTSLFILIIGIRIYKKIKNIEVEKDNLKKLIPGGILCGVLLFLAANLQQFGMERTSAGKAGFITALYIVIVPILGLFFKKKISINIIISVVIAVVGLYFLCIDGSFSISKYDLMIMGCAFVFSFHIITIDYYAKYVDCIKLSCIQFFVAGILSIICSLSFEEIKVSNIVECIWPLLYVGILSSAVAYTTQILAQKGSNPTIISLILSLESVFSIIGGWIILNNVLSLRESIGCILMMAAVILAQIPIQFKRRNKE